MESIVAAKLSVEVLIGLGILIVSGFSAFWAKRGAKTSERLLELSEQDLDMHVGFLGDKGQQIRDKLRVAPGGSFQLGITNLGGTTCPPGEVRITAGPGVQRIEPQSNWQDAEKHPKMPPASKAWRARFREVTSGEIVAFSGFQVPENYDFTGGRLRWEVFVEGRGANSADIRLARDR